MIKKILFTIFALIFIFISVALFQYFSYWGLGFSAILLVIILCSAIIISTLSWAIDNRKKIADIINWLIYSLTETHLYQKINGWLQSRQPHLYQLLKKRLAKNSPTGLYATIGGLVTAIFLFHFLAIVFDLIFKDPLYLADARTIDLFRAFISTGYIPFFVLITSLANASSVLVILAAAVITLLIYRNYRAIQYLVMTVASGFIFYWLIKLITHRPRPQGISYILLPQSFSFPSGHAAIAVCLYGFIAYLLFKKFKGATRKAIIIVAFLLLSGLIGISRIYLGVHYPSDVMAGWYLGLAVLAGFITAYEIRNKFYPLKQPTQKQTWLTLIIIIVLILISLASIYQTYNSTAIIEPKHEAINTTAENFLKAALKYSENLLGAKMEPINFIIIGEKQSIINIFSQAGWHQAEQPTLTNVFKELSAIAKNTNYPTGPMTPAFYNMQANDLGFEKAVLGDATARFRHHTRYWQTDYQANGQSLWVATASLDQGVEIGSAIKLPTHKIDPHIDSEREYIFEDLLATGQIKSYRKIDLVGQTSGTNASGDKFFTDGKAYIIELL